MQSIMPFLDHWHYNYTLDALFDEVRTESLPTTDSRQYLSNKKYAFNHQSSFSETQESFDHALERFNQGIRDVTLRFPKGKILIVSHGTILTLYFAQLQGDLENGEKLYQRWVNLQFGAVGVIKNGRITQNIHDDENDKDGKDEMDKKDEKKNKGPFKPS